MSSQLPMFKCSRDFITLSLNGSRPVENRLNDENRATVPTTLDHHIVRPSTETFSDMSLLQFAQRYKIPQTLGSQPTLRNKNIIVICRPYCPPNPESSTYEQYCRQSLMKHKPFQQFSELLSNHETYASAYAEFLQSANIPSSLEDDFRRLSTQQDPERNDSEVCPQ